MKFSMAASVPLKVDRALLNPKFEGYKLSLDPLPIYELALTNDVSQISPNDTQYSLQHVKSFNLHNHLFLDPWNFKNLYYIDIRNAVIRILFDEHRRFQEPLVVFQLPRSLNSKSNGRFNSCISFVSANQVLVGEGSGTLYLLETGNRLGDQEWQVVFKSSKDCFTSPFMLLHGIGRPDGTVSALLLYIGERKASEYGKAFTGPFLNVVIWIDLVLDESEWKIARTRKLVGNGNIEYTSLSAEKDFVYLASDRPYKFVFDSLLPIAFVPEEARKEMTLEAKIPVLYAWFQTEEDVTVTFKLPKDVKKDDISVFFTPSTFKLVVSNQSLSLCGNLFAKIDVDESTWTLTDDTLEVFMSKLEIGLPWNRFIDGDDRGEEISDMTTKEEIFAQLEYLTSENSPLINNKPAFDNQQLEECDAYPVEYIVMYKIHGDTHEVSEMVNLSANQWLFSATLSPQLPPAFCVRHDVDGIVWQPTVDGFEHKITFNALGYVLASKRERKFGSCSPDGLYAAISDSRKHIYIYHQPNALESKVRNRRTGEEINSIAYQRIASLESLSDILGIQLSHENIYVLTDNVMYVIRVQIG